MSHESASPCDDQAFVTNISRLEIRPECSILAHLSPLSVAFMEHDFRKNIDCERGLFKTNGSLLKLSEQLRLINSTVIPQMDLDSPMPPRAEQSHVLCVVLPCRASTALFARLISGSTSLRVGNTPKSPMSKTSTILVLQLTTPLWLYRKGGVPIRCHWPDEGARLMSEN